MRLSPSEALARLLVASHGVMATVHPLRGADAIPVVYAAASYGSTEGDFLVIPIDTVKPKTTTKLQRINNLEADPRAALLVEHWTHDHWDELWWVRADLRWLGSFGRLEGRHAELTARLVEAFPQYRAAPFSSLLLFKIEGVTGWSAR